MIAEFIIEEAALEWFLLRQGFEGHVGELGCEVGRGPHLAPGELAAGREKGRKIKCRTSHIKHRSKEQRHRTESVRHMPRMTLFGAEPGQEVAE